MTRRATTVESQLEKRLEFETLISDTSASLFAVPSEQVDLAVERALGRVRKFFQVDRCALLSVSSDQSIVTVRLSSNAEGVEDVSGELNLAEAFPWSRHRLLVEHLPIRISRISELPAEAKIEIQAWRQLQIRSALTLPVVSDGGISHLILLNAVHQECEWPDALVTRLKVLGELLVGALKRQELLRELRSAEKRLNLAAEFAEAGLWSLDTRTGKIWGTEPNRAMCGFPQDAVLSMDLLKSVVHPDDWNLVQGVVEGSKHSDEQVGVEYRIVRPDDGTVRWIKSSGRPFHDPTEEMESLLGISIDITAQKDVEEALRKSESRLASGAHLAGLAFYEVDYEEKRSYIDDAFRLLCGITSDHAHGLEPVEFWAEHVHPDDRPEVLRLRQQLHEGIVEQISIEYRFMNPVVGQVWIHHRAHVARRDAKGCAIATYGVLREITDRRKAEDELHELSQHLISAHEEERALLARELHDDLTQRLAVLSIEVGRAESVMVDSAHAKMMRSVQKGLVKLNEDIHYLAYQLHPSILTELGLVEAIRAEADRLGRQGMVDVSLDLDPLPSGLEADKALCLFRIAQAALSNVVRHSGVRTASVALRRNDDDLLLTVHDDGNGFDPIHVGEEAHLGLLSMRERARLVCGTLGVESAPGQGTTISVRVVIRGGS